MLLKFSDSYETDRINSNEQNFLASYHGMAREFSGDVTMVPQHQPQVFDEEKVPGKIFGIQRSGEVRFDNSTYSNESQTHLVELVSKLKRQKTWVSI